MSQRLIRIPFSIYTKRRSWLRRWGIFTVAVCLLAVVPMAHTQVAETEASTPSGNEEHRYGADFFNQYNPQSALDMVERLPGFSFDEGSNARGFGGNAGNVLIDGSRPTSKSGGLRQALVRIPAAQVDYIRILRGGVSAGDAGGQSVVANVVRSTSGTSGTWDAKFRRAPDGGVRPNIEGSLATQVAGWGITSKIDIGRFANDRSALIRDLDADNNLLGSQTELLDVDVSFREFSIEANRSLAGGKLSLNNRLFHREFSDTFNRNGFDNRLPSANTADSFRGLGDFGDDLEIEMGADWARTFDNDWKLNGLVFGLYETDEFNSASDTEEPLGMPIESSALQLDQTAKEFIARVVYSRVGDSEFNPEFGFEVASNQLDSQLQIDLNGAPLVVGGANTSVSELRAELFGNFVWSINEQLSVDGGLTAEFSEIQVEGDANQKQSFQFLKPQLTATYRFNEQVQWQLQLSRKVGQLDFSDFASSAEIVDDRTTSGNPNLSPDNRIDIRSILDWKFSERGSLKVEAFHESRRDILEQIQLPSGEQGLGNAGDATFYGIETQLDLPLEGLLPGGLLEVEANWRDSSFDDPISRQQRRISDFTPRWIGVELRQDLTESQLSWGLRLRGAFNDERFFADEIRAVRGNRRWNAFIETTRWFGVKLRFEVENLNTAEFERTRRFFNPDRSGALSGLEISERRIRPQFRIDISGQF